MNAQESTLSEIKARARKLTASLPGHVSVVAAAKTRTPTEVQALLHAGLMYIGHNYVQEAQAMRPRIDRPAQWHMIGHLQRNKVRIAVQLFDMIETVDSVRLAREIDKRCAVLDKVMPVLIEVNSARETLKSGVLSEHVASLIEDIQPFTHIQVRGLMTMGPLLATPQQIEPYFARTRKLYEQLSSLDLPRVEMRFLSMGMSSSYQVAIDQGANLIRIGTLLFGPRTY